MSDQENIELVEFKKDLLNKVHVSADAGGNFSSNQFYTHVTELLTDAEIYDDIQEGKYIHSKKGIKIDGWNWNVTERYLSGVIIDFSDDEELTTISKSEIEKLGKRASKFIANINNPNFRESLDASDPALETCIEMSQYLSDRGIDGEDGFIPAAHKFRIIIITDHLMSSRVKLNKLKTDYLHEKETSFEIWDLKRIRDLALSGTVSEPCNVDFSDYCDEGGLPTLPANLVGSNIRSYISVIPGTVLRDLFADFNQRLLESNVRTFLQFRGKVNKGMKSTLLQSPENFFAYNNGLTVTASDIELEENSGKLVIKKLDNMQIVNGGQTTSAIYFSPLSKGNQSGIDFREIDLSKVFVQMKLAVIDNDEESDNLKTNVAKYANTQNNITDADLISNHALHRSIETQSRAVWSPPSESSAVMTKWFYERARGQYQTKILSFRTNQQRNAFEAENPKQQMFTKTDMAKYENTWRMKPMDVATGAQGNLNKIGPILIKEWDQNHENFGIMFFKDLVAKAILFKSTDKAILKSDWYRENPGFKAQTVTYTLALLLHKLAKKGEVISLKRIFENQKVSETLSDQIMDLAKLVKIKLHDEDFKAGANSNPQMFAKTIIAWDRFKEIDYKLEIISKDDTISKKDEEERQAENYELNELNAEIDISKFCHDIPDEEWSNIYEFLKQFLPIDTKDMKTLNKFTMLSRPNMQRRLQHPDDYDTAKKLRAEAIDKGYVVPE